MHTDKPLYEPELVEYWAKRYREFETADLERRVLDAKAKMQERAGGRKPDRRSGQNNKAA
jgi:hypothetical protein